MFQIFTDLADYLTYTLFSMNPENHWAQAIHFFIEDTTKIFFLLIIMIYTIALVRSSINTEWVRDHLAGRNRYYGYVMASLFGAITPFCSCSSIPLFLGFTQARIPLGITMSFLITSPMINEVAVVLLGGLLGWKFTIAYCLVGVGSGIIGGWFFDAIGAQKNLTDLGNMALHSAAESSIENGQPACNCNSASCETKPKTTWAARRKFAWEELTEIIGRIWKWVVLGIGVGALVHGLVPQEWIIDHLGKGQWWTVPSAVLLGIPLYTNASGVIPVAESLLGKGLPIGTTLAFMMSVVAASFPEFMMLKQVMKPKLLLTFFVFLLVLFTLTGWLFNLLWTEGIHI